MMPAELDAVLEATWPAASTRRVGGFVVREGQGAGKRVSAATPIGPWSDADIAAAEQAMRNLGQVPLFRLRPDDAVLDEALAGRRYRVVDPLVAMAADCATLAPGPLPPQAAIPHWPPLHLLREIWEERGIGKARQAVMERVTGPKTVILGRLGDRVAGVAFVAAQGGDAMLHALEVLPELRRKGCGAAMVRQAAAWAAAQGAGRLSLVVVADNTPARALYASLGMQNVGQYHYRTA